MNPDEKAISLVGTIILLIFLLVTILYGGPILDWIDSLP